MELEGQHAHSMFLPVQFFQCEKALMLCSHWRFVHSKRERKQCRLCFIHRIVIKINDKIFVFAQCEWTLSIKKLLVEEYVRTTC